MISNELGLIKRKTQKTAMAWSRDNGDAEKLRFPSFLVVRFEGEEDGGGWWKGSPVAVLKRQKAVGSLF